MLPENISPEARLPVPIPLPRASPSGPLCQPVTELTHIKPASPGDNVLLLAPPLVVISGASQRAGQGALRRVPELPKRPTGLFPGKKN